MPRILRRTPPPNDCCRPYYTGVRLGVFPDPEPPPEFNLFLATVPLSGGFGENIVAGSFGSSFIPHDLGSNLAVFLKSNYSTNSGAVLLKGDTEYVFWILAETAPLDWTWEGGAIVFGDAGLASLKCWTTGAFNTAPASSSWTPIDSNNEMGTGSMQGITANFADAAFPAQWADYVNQVYGAAATASQIINATDVTLTVTNTYLTLIDLIYFDGVTQVTTSYNSCP